MDESWWIGIIGIALALSTFFIGRFTAHRQEGEKAGTMASDIGYIKAGIDELKDELKTIRAEVSEMATRLAKAEASISSAHKRIDEIIQKKG